MHRIWFRITPNSPPAGPFFGFAPFFPGGCLAAFSVSAGLPPRSS
jgi:hypothetical protein